MSKAACAGQAICLTDIPNIGSAIAADLRGLGGHTPQHVRNMAPLALYASLCSPEGSRPDPCVLDVFLAAHDFMNGGAPRPWWAYTAQRKAMLATDKKI